MKANPKESKKLFTVRLEEHIIKDIKLLSVDLDRPISDLLGEAVNDLVRKHGRTEVTYSSKTETKMTKTLKSPSKQRTRTQKERHAE